MSLDTTDRLFYALSSATYDRVTVRSNFSPDLSINVAETLNDSAPSVFGPLVQPMITLEGPAGKLVLAPYGEPGFSGGKLLVGIIAAAFAVAFLAGFLVVRR